MRTITGIIISLIGGAVVGVLLALGVLRFVSPEVDSVRARAWQSTETAGSADGGLHERALIALHGMLALQKMEAMYFTAYEDDTGAPLVSSCVYRLEGGAMPARWWSLTAYGADGYLIPHEEKMYAFTQSDFAAMGMPAYSLTLSRARAHGPWIALARNDEAFSLTLRLYNPEVAHYEAARYAEIPQGALPRISREMCL